MSLSGLFDIARSALTTSQTALTVTGHNVANLNTPGFSRQEAVVTERPPLNGQPGMMGTGVQALSIRRFADQFVNRQLTTSEQNLGRLSVARDELFRLQNLLADSNDEGLAARLNDFFQGLQDVSTNPNELTARSVLLANAAQLAGSLNQASSQLETSRQSLNFQVKQTVTEINSLAKQIAELNDKIVAAEVTGQNANDLRDQRDLAVNELAQRIDVTTIESGSGALSVFVARGQVVVESGGARELSAFENPSNDGMLSVGYSTGGTKALSIDALVSNGRLRSLLDIRDGTVRDLQRSVDRLATTLVNEVNQVHRQGFGLDGSTGNNLFGPITVTTASASDNTGSSTIGSGVVTANGLLTQHDYEIRFSSPTAYSIVDATTGSLIRGNYSGAQIPAPTAAAPVAIVTGSNDTLTVTVDGTTSGTITLAGAALPGIAYASGAALAQEVQSKINGDSALQAAGKTVSVVFDTTANRLVLTSNSTTSTSAVDVIGGTARAALGLSTGTATAASGTYSGPRDFSFDGISVTVTGAPAAGDVLEANSYHDGAKTISVSLSDPSAVAAASNRAGIPGDNANALALVALQHRQYAALDEGTFNDAYRSMASGLGVQAQSADRDRQAQEVLRDQIQTFRAEVSGVSLDEELVNLIKYQRSFEAASRLIKVTDELFQTLLSLKP
ncbi:First flagellar hook-filament junction protein FlgK [Nitrospira sp. KM1]|uniref:flagellar hook-associated protein FlgK n=1 Tax=Nitrospira sp. KM1 TaxID=1936990 RepID=UPI0013A72CC0|nr:flagellar hook-associated protein FlgK [Nitrospira sp. KM1]BCA54788.1 First flagellar hook-filament junction protein FlgK [Nitrospira sp. KM1]